MLKILLILIPFRFFSTYLNVGYITPVGKVKVASFLVLVFGAINVALDYLLIGIYGFIGVVYATVVTQLLYMFLKDLHFFKLFLCIEKKEEYA
jgi:O-antigen/teichoic acid export membrane protein